VVGGDGTVYIASEDGSLSALNPADGSKRWQFRSEYTVSGTPCLAPDGTLYVCGYRTDTTENTGMLFAVDSSSGRVRWTYTLALEANSALLLDSDGTLYIGTDTSNGNIKGDLIAFDTRTQREKWSVNLGSMHYSSPALGMHNLVYAVLNDRLYALQRENGQVLWTFAPDRGTGVTRVPSVDREGNVYVFTGDSHLVSLDGRTGVMRWSFPLDCISVGYLCSASFGKGDLLYVGTSPHYRIRGAFYAIDRQTGKLRWRWVPEEEGDGFTGSPVVGSDEKVYALTMKGRLIVFDGATGKIEREVRIGELFLTPALTPDGTLYTGGGSRVYAIR
jgi:outer membrane protein assembly factor BamB